MKPSPPTDTGRQQCVRYWNRWQSGYIVSFKTYLICIYLYIVVILLYYVILVYCSYINLSWIGGPIFGRQLGTFLPEPSPSCNLTACHAFNHRFSERYPGVYSYKMWKTQESRGKRSSLQEDKSSTNRHVFLVGGWASPLKNLSSSVGIIIPNIRGNNNVPNHQPDSHVATAKEQHVFGCFSLSPHATVAENHLGMQWGVSVSMTMVITIRWGITPTTSNQYLYGYITTY